MFRKALQVLSVISVLIATSLTSIPANAAGCSSGGSGTAGDPYIICSTTDFNQISGHPAWHFKLGTNLDFTGYNPPSTNLNGELDGNGKTISNFSRTITDPYGGLFQYIEYGAYVHDLKLDNVKLQVVGGPYAAPLAGILYGRAERIQVSGTISSDANYSTGLVGIIWGDATLKDSISTVVISRTTDVYTYIYGLAAILWGDDPQQGGDGIPQVSNSLYLATGNLWALPKYAPWYDIHQGGNYPYSSCDVVTGVYSLVDDDNQTASDCGGRINFDALGKATSQTSGFTSFSSDVWNFGDSKTLPLLTVFPQAPSSPRGVSVVNNGGSVLGQVLPGFDGGSPLTGYDVQVKQAGGTWHSYTGQFLEPSTFSAYSLTSGAYYEFRVRAVTAFGVSDWVSAPQPVMAGDNSNEIQTGNATLLSVSTGLLTAPQLSNIATLPNGLKAVAFTDVLANGTSILGVKIFNTAGRIFYQGNIGVFTSSDSEKIISGDGRLSVAVSPKGVVAVAYVVKTVSGNNVTTTAKVREFTYQFGSDLGVLDVENAIPARTIDKTSSVCNQDSNCGYENIQIASDVAGNFTVAATYPTGTAKNLVASSQLRFGNWLTASLEAEAAVESISMIPGKTGVLVGWVNRGATSVAKYSLLKKSGTSTWAPSVTIDTQVGSVTGSWVRRSAGIASFAWAVNGLTSDAVKVLDFDLTKLKSPKPATLITSPVGIVRTLSVSSSQQGELSLAWDEKARASNEHSINTLTVSNANVAGTVSTFGAFTGADVADLVSTSSISGTPVITWVTDLEDGPQVYVAVTNAAGIGVRNLPGISSTLTEPRFDFLPTGDVMYVALGSSGSKKIIEMNKILLGKAPEISAWPVLEGETKVGKTLSVRSGNWISYAPVLKSNIQWWRCPANFAGQLDQSYGCVPIPGATKQTYKAAKADKGKILGVTVDATNLFGKTSRSIALNTSIG
jgi:hypothetical protein